MAVIEELMQAQVIYMDYLLKKANKKVEDEHSLAFDPQGRVLTDITLTDLDYKSIVQSINKTVPPGGFSLNKIGMDLALGRNTTDTTTVSLDLSHQDVFKEALRTQLIQVRSTDSEKIIQLLEETPKGSHILVAKLYEGQQAYFLQHSDKRIVFVIPYHGFSMIGTTNIPYSGLPDEVHISGEEINYLTSVVNTYFQIALSKNDMIYSWSGLRPLLAVAGKEHNALSRDYTFELTTSPAPAVTIYGGKITTYRQLAEEVINQLRCVFPQMNPTQTRHTPLPGACFNRMNFEQYVLYAKDKYSWLHPDLLSRYLFNYGSCMELFLSRCKDMESMGEKFGSSLYQVEVDYLLREEWACDYDDILTRRTKLGLTMDATSKKELTKYLERTTIVVPAEPVSR